jgi:hypothetical protein
MPSEQCPYGKDICVYCQKPWSRHGCGDVDAQHEREMAALRAEIHELADALLRVTGGMQEIAAVLQVPNDVPVIDCVIKALAERDELQATVAVLRDLFTEYANKPDYLDAYAPIRNALRARIADAFGVPQT